MLLQKKIQTNRIGTNYTGSPRQIFQLYQDAMSIVRRYGKPAIFITFTCNPHWTEITSSLLIDQKASDRPGLIVRVFRMKLRELHSDILKKLFLIDMFTLLNLKYVVFLMPHIW